MRVTTLLNELLNLQGLQVTGLRFEDDLLVLAVCRRFRVLTSTCCGATKRGRMSSRTEPLRRG